MPTRKSLELESNEWAALDRLAEVTNSLTTTNNQYSGQPSWRVFVKRLAGSSERTQQMIQQALQQDSLDEIILNWSNMADQLPDEEVKKWEASLPDKERQQWQDFLDQKPSEQADLKWHVARSLFYQRSLAEARRLGYQPDPETVLNHNPIVLVEMAQGYDDGRALMGRWGFGTDQPHSDDPHHIAPHYEPSSMWDVMAYRRDGNAIVAIIGDDRGWKQHWTYYAVVAWFPKYLETKYDPTYCLI